MPFSSGVYTLPNPALVTGEVVSATENNTTRNDLAGALNLTMLRNGTSTATANLPMGGYKLTGLGAPSANGDSLAYGQAAVISDFTASGTVTISSGTANGVAYLNGSKVLTTGSALTFDGSNLSVVGTGSTILTGGNQIQFTRNGANYINATLSTLNYGASQHVYGNNDLSSEWMRLTSTGLGIGTSSPSYKLNVVSSGNGTNSRFTNGSSIVDIYNGSGTSYIGDAGVNNSIGFTTSHSSITFYTSSGIERMRLDSSGNLGLGVTPSAWAYAGKGIDLADYGFVSSHNPICSIFANTYYNGSNWTYKTTNAASWYFQDTGAHKWLTAPSGTAGNAISFTQAMTLDASGNLGVGVTNPQGKIHAMKTATGNTPQNPAGNQIVIENGDSSGSADLQFLAPSNGYSHIFFGDAADANVGVLLYDHTSNSMQFTTNTAERMRIDSSGNVGIGTSSPNKTGFTAPVLSITNGTSGIVELVGTQTADGTIGQVAWYNTSGSSRIGQILGLRSGADTSGAITFQTASSGTLSERMRIDSSGRVLVGTSTAPGGGGNDGVKGVCISPGDPSSVIIQNKSDANMYLAKVSGYTLGDFVQFYVNGTQVGKIYTGGTTTTYATSSDYRLKENIQPMQNALATVAQLNPVTYTWKADGSDGQGFIAHELQAVVPDCVTGEKDAVDEEGKPVYQGIDTSFLVATLTKAIQELKAELDATKAEVAALKGN